MTQAGRPLVTDCDETKGKDEEIAAPAAPAGPDPNRLPPWYTISVIFGMLALYTTELVVIAPTATPYVEVLGGDRPWAGFITSMMPIFTLVMCLCTDKLMMKNVNVKYSLAATAAGYVIGGVVYALAYKSQTKWMLLAGRGFMGAFAFPGLILFYWAWSVGVNVRSKIMLLQSAFLAIGYGLGPLIALIVNEIVTRAKWSGDILNMYSAPGWFMAVFIAIYFVFILRMEKPIVPPSPPSQPIFGQPGTPWFAAFVSMVNQVVRAMCVGSWELFTAEVAELRWGWSFNWICAFLSITMFATIPVTMFAQKALAGKYPDWKPLLAFTAGAVVFAVLLFDFGLTGAARTVVYTIGSFGFNSCCQVSLGFNLAIPTKIFPGHLRQYLITATITALSIGRSIGPQVASNTNQNGHAVVLVASCFVAAVLTAVANKQLEPHADER